MQLVQRLQEIPVAVRIIISGTPIQNNLMEMHSLFDFACEVQLLAMLHGSGPDDCRFRMYKHLLQFTVAIAKMLPLYRACSCCT